MLAIARKAISKFRFLSRAIGLPTRLATETNIPNEQHSRTRRRLHGNAVNSRRMNNLRGQYRGATAVRTRVQVHNSLRKERSFQRALRTENGAGTSSRSNGDVHLDAEEFKAQLEKERLRVEAVMAAKDAERRAQREDRERRRREEELELEEVRRAEARRKAEAEIAASRIVRQLQEEHEVRLQEERQARIEAERTANLTKVRVARLEEAARLACEREEAESARLLAERERVARLEKELELARQREKQEADEHARQRLDEFVQSTLNPAMLEELNMAFQAQEDHLRAHVEQAARFYAQPEQPTQFQPQPAGFYAQPEQPAQDEWWRFIPEIPDISMMDPSFFSIPDISMASLPPQEPASVLTTNLDWFNSYEARWLELLNPNYPGPLLTVPSFPWPAFRSINTLDELDEGEIKSFFSLKYPGKLDRNWKTELTRWHPDKLERLKSKIFPDCLESVREGFLRCVKVMNALRAEERTSQ